MLTSFFSKSKPLHFVAIGLLLLLVFIVAKALTLDQPLTFMLFGKQTFYYIVLFASLFMLDFFVSKNKLSQKTSYHILMFGLFIAALPETVLNSRILISNLFILLALRRIISLRSQKAIKKKLFDGAFWISVATLFYVWSALFFLVILFALLFYSLVTVKHLIIPLTAVLTTIIISISVLIVMNLDIWSYVDYVDYSFDFSHLNSKRIIIAATLFLSYGVWGSFYYLRNLKSKTKSYRPSFLLVIISALIALAIIVVAPDKDGSEFLFLFAPLSIIVSNYFEVVKEKWFRETLVWILIAIPILTLLL